MHKSYVNGEGCWRKTLSAVPDVVVNWKWGKMPHLQQYESSEGVALSTKGSPGGFSGYCYNFGNSGYMSQDYPEPRKEQGENSGQAGEDA